MLRSAASKVMWVGRATVFLVGLAVILALTVGVVSRATAHTGSAGLFHLNHNNPVTALSTLTGTLTGSVLKVDNNGTGSALQLEVGSGKAPLSVNSTAGKATNLNADKLDGQNSSAFLGANAKAADANLLDGKDSSQFLPTSTYVKSLAFTTNGGGGVDGNAWTCDQGDVLLSGGGKLNDVDQQEIVQSRPISNFEWFVSVKDTTAAGQGAGFEISVLCADLGTPHNPG